VEPLLRSYLRLLCRLGVVWETAIRYRAAPYIARQERQAPMSTDPTTTSQVQAYRFGLRRMESALVRRDAVMLHEPMRHQLRATVVGLLVAVLLLVGFFVVGRIHPRSALTIISAVAAGAV
jgi:hypothetical protein